MKSSNNYLIEICKRFKIDRRLKPFFYNGDLVCNDKFTGICTGCDGVGCSECGYRGKRIVYFPNLLVSREEINATP